MKRSEPFILILVASSLWIGCNQSPSGSNNASQPNGPKFCDGNNCEEKALDLKVNNPNWNSMQLKPEELNSLNQAVKQTAGGQAHVEGTAVNGSLQFRAAPGPAQVAPDVPQIAVSSGQDAKALQVPLSPDAVELARRRTTSGSH